MNYFKQYGELRTGTNYLKRLIEINFKSVTVFGSVLGWKHGTYDLGNQIDNTKSHREWIDKKTINNVVYSVDNLPLKYTPEELYIASEKLFYIFNIKKPIPFILSYKKFRMPRKELTENIIKNLCKRYNERYTSWLEMFNRYKNNSIIVPHESLLHDYSHVLFSLKTKFDLETYTAGFKNESKIVKASTDVGLLIGKQKFNSDYYTNELYLNDIKSSHIDLIDDLIDHDLVNKFYRLGV